MRRILFILLFVPTLALAVKVPNLYQAIVPVASRSQADFEQGLGQAYKQVLIKVSGNSGVATLPGVQQSTSQLRDVVQRYSYDITTTDTGQPELLLKVLFDSGSIRNILRHAGQTLWQDNRPLTIVWLAYDGDEGLSVVSGSTNNALEKALVSNSERRGLPILLPMVDLQDMSVVSPKDVWMLDAGDLELASERYNVVGILGGRIYLVAGGKWSGDWLWILNGQKVFWQTKGNTASEAIAEVMDDLANALAQRYATLASNGLQTQLTLKIVNVDGLPEYTSVMYYLKSLTPVTKVQLVDIQLDSVTVQIDLAGDQQDLMQALQQNNVLTTVPKSENNGNEDLLFRWQGSQRAGK